MPDKEERLQVLVRNHQGNIVDVFDCHDPFIKNGSLRLWLRKTVRMHLNKGRKVELTLNTGR